MDSTYYPLTNDYSGYVLDVVDGNGFPDSQLHMFPFNGTAGQMWKLTDDGYLLCGLQTYDGAE